MLGFLRSFLAPGRSIARLTLALALLLVGWTTPARADPSSSAADPDVPALIIETRVQSMVKSVLPSAGATRGAGISVTASDGSIYRALWQLTPPAAGQFNPPAATARVIIQRVISGVATTLNASDWAGDLGIGAALSLTVWPDQRVTAKATTSTSIIAQQWTYTFF